MLLMAPMTMNIFKAVGKNPVPLLMAQVTFLLEHDPLATPDFLYSSPPSH